MSSPGTQVDIFQSGVDPRLWPTAIPEKDLVLFSVLPIEPESKARPRIGKGGHVYTPSKTTRYENAIALSLKTQLHEVSSTNMFGVRAIFRRSDAQRVDTDNMLKAVLDAITKTGRVWEDDSQCLEVVGKTFRRVDNPSLALAIYRLGESETGGLTVCAHCGERFKTYPSVNSRFCSNDCANESRRALLVCAYCEHTFSIPISLVGRTRTGKQYCSRECSVAGNAEVRKENGRYKWKCADCGQLVSRREYKVCRACSMKHRSDTTSNYWKLRYENGLAKLPVAEPATDDAQVRDITIRRREDKSNPRVEIEVYPLNGVLEGI